MWGMTRSDEADHPADGHGHAHHQRGDHEQVAAQAGDVDAQGGGRFGSHGQGVEAAGLGQQIAHGHYQGHGRDRQLGPGGVTERTQQPEQHRLGGLRVAPKQQEAGDGLEQRGKHHPAQDQLGGRQLAAGARHQRTPWPWPPWRRARCRPTGPTPPARRTPRKAIPRWRPRWPPRTRLAGTGRPGRFAPAPGPRCRPWSTRHPPAPPAELGACGSATRSHRPPWSGVTGQVVGDHLPYLGRAQPDGSDANAEYHHHGQQQCADDQHPAQRGAIPSSAAGVTKGDRPAPQTRGAPPVRFGVDGRRCVLLVVRRTQRYRKPNLDHRTNQPLLRGPATSVLSQATGLVPQGA